MLSSFRPSAGQLENKSPSPKARTARARFSDEGYYFAVAGLNRIGEGQLSWELTLSSAARIKFRVCKL